MIRILKFCIVSIFLYACNDGGSDSPFQSLLEQKPFKVITDSISSEPSNPDLYFRRAVLLNSNDFPEPALADFRTAWRLKKHESYALGISTLLLEKKADSARHFLEDALKELPESVLLKISLARTYVDESRFEEAMKICDDILNTQPDHVDVMKLKADLFQRMGKNREAIDMLRKAYALTPFDVELNYILAFAYSESKDVRVLALADSLMKADVEKIHAEPHYYKGLYYSNIGDQRTALQEFNLAIQRDYNFLDAHIEKGIVLYEQKKYEEAYNAFNLAMTIRPKYADAYYWMAKCQVAVGNRQEAILNFQRAYGLDKTLIEAKNAADSLNKLRN